MFCSYYGKGRKMGSSLLRSEYVLEDLINSRFNGFDRNWPSICFADLKEIEWRHFIATYLKDIIEVRWGVYNTIT